MTRASLTINVTLLVMAACTVIGLFFLDGRDVRLFAGHRHADAAARGRETTFLAASAATFRDLGTMFLHPRATPGSFLL